MFLKKKLGLPSLQSLIYRDGRKGKNRNVIPLWVIAFFILLLYDSNRNLPPSISATNFAVKSLYLPYTAVHELHIHDWTCLRYRHQRRQILREHTRSGWVLVLPLWVPIYNTDNTRSFLLNSLLRAKMWYNIALFKNWISSKSLQYLLNKIFTAAYIGQWQLVEI